MLPACMDMDIYAVRPGNNFAHLPVGKTIVAFLVLCRHSETYPALPILTSVPEIPVNFNCYDKMEIL
ncbi:MAG: hypothetical protein AB7S54_10115 [Bacteroidales bacterium]